MSQDWQEIALPLGARTIRGEATGFSTDNGDPLQGDELTPHIGLDVRWQQKGQSDATKRVSLFCGVGGLELERWSGYNSSRTESSDPDVEVLEVKITRARALGTCFGVRDAIEAALDPCFSGDLTIVGQLVHNPQTVAQLRQNGVQMVDSVAQEITTSNVMITAHGASENLKEELRERGHIVYDASCPLVLRVHKAIRRLVEEGWHPVVIGQSDHVEVRGIVGDLDDFTVVGDLEDLDQLEGRSRIGIVCQTTHRIRHAQEILSAIRTRYPEIEIEFVDTVCKPTKDRQNAVDELTDQVDLMIVVGGYNSSNTRKLMKVCREKGVLAHHIETESQLEADWFDSVDHVGITAGTSTPHEVIDAVHARILEITP
ncbi:MAG: 4-hydroxy-3-methylbut-2-enyl diphosphate reductase [Planctomycetota bacterium]